LIATPPGQLVMATPTMATAKSISFDMDGKLLAGHQPAAGENTATQTSSVPSTTCNRQVMRNQAQVEH